MDLHTMDNWKKMVLSRNLDDIHPPAFMHSDDNGEHSTGKNRLTVIKEHYGQVRTILNEHGYANLIEMTERLQIRRSEMEPRFSEVADSRVFYLKAQYSAFQQKHPEMEGAPLPGEVGGRGSRLDTPIGKAWLDDNGNLQSDGGWEVEVKESGDSSGASLSNMEISLPPKAITEASRKGDEPVDKIKGRLDLEELRPSDRLRFTGDTTWTEVINSFESRLRSFAETADRISRTRELIDFRVRIAEAVLSRFEMLGVVPELTEEETSELVEQGDKVHPERIMTWQRNAASLYAYLEKYERPESMNEFAEEVGISTRQAWDQLKDRGYGTGQGVDGLIEALREWAPEFERHYGTEKASKAAWPSEWPEEHEA